MTKVVREVRVVEDIDPATLICPLCKAASGCKHYHRDKRRNYWQCAECQLVFVAAVERLSPEAEKAEYDLHENNPEDAGYRQFLSRVATPLQQLLPAGARGLDFGSGPGPTLSLMMTEAGFPTANYDVYYANDKKLLEEEYDFISATEVIEHICEPAEVLPKLWTQIKPGGVLALMTKLVIDIDAFARWHYKNDPTHICFYSQDTFRFLADKWDASVDFVGKDVVILRKALPLV